LFRHDRTDSTSGFNGSTGAVRMLNHGGESDDDPGRAISPMPGLDGLRGVAILLVLGTHFGTAAGFAVRPGGTLGAFLDRVFYLGWSGVDLFFVLSGFLITSILLSTRHQPNYFRLFYGRRALRIFPLYYFAVIFGLFVLPTLWPARSMQLLDNSRAEQIWIWSYTLNIADAFGWATSAGVLAHFWSLAIEEQYYLVWPSLVKVSSEQGLRRLCIGLIVGALALRLIWLLADFPGGWRGAYLFTLTRVDALAVGSLIAGLMRDAEWQRRLSSIAWPGLMLGLIAVAIEAARLPRFYPNEFTVVTFGHSVLALMFGCLLILAVQRHLRVGLESRWLRAMGKYSYGIYVWHWPLQRVMLLQPEAFTPVVFLTIGIVGSTTLGWISYHLLEKPFLHLKRYFAYQEPQAGLSRAYRPAPRL